MREDQAGRGPGLVEVGASPDEAAVLAVIVFRPVVGLDPLGNDRQRLAGQALAQAKDDYPSRPVRMAAPTNGQISTGQFPPL